MKKEKHDANTNDHKSNEIKIERESSKNISQEPANNEEIKKLEEQINSANLKIVQLEKEVEDYKDRVLRKAAEFENYKRRTENEQINLLKYSAESFIIKLLPAIDDFERSLQHIDKAKDVESIKEGIKLVYEKFIKILGEQGVTKIDSAGKPFDVQYHEALLQRPAENVAPHTVLDEIEKGYMYKDRVIRHAKVVVSQDLSEDKINSSDINSDTQNNNEGK